MTNELKETIQNFLVDWDNTFNPESFGLADYNLWLETAVELLQKCVDDYKIIPQDQKSWHYAKPIIGVDDKGNPMPIDSWNDKITRSINNGH